MPAQKTKITKLKVTRCNLVFAGKNTRGDEYTLFEIEATGLDGAPISHKLRSFCSLPIDVETEVVVTPFPSERHGMSFTLAPTGQKSSSNTQRINELFELVKKLTERVQALEGKPVVAAALTPAPVAQPAAGDPGNGGLS